MNNIKSIIGFILVLYVTGCSAIYSRVTYDFEKIDSDLNLQYEKGAKDIALEISQFLPEVLLEIETRQYKVFKSKPEIRLFIFNDKQRYANYSMASIKTRGSATKNEIYISPIIRERMHTLRSIVSHELSHVHIRQYIGTWRYVNDTPGWFLEGLAVDVSAGGGAENVTEAEAKKYFIQGKHFQAVINDGFLQHKTAHDFGLKPHMYYRQSAMFVAYLKAVGPEQFKACYLDLVNGVSFADVWQKHYSKSLAELWQAFLATMQT